MTDGGCCCCGGGGGGGCCCCWRAKAEVACKSGALAGGGVVEESTSMSLSKSSESSLSRSMGLLLLRWAEARFLFLFFFIAFSRLFIFLSVPALLPLAAVELWPLTLWTLDGLGLRDNDDDEEEEEDRAAVVQGRSLDIGEEMSVVLSWARPESLLDAVVWVAGVGREAGAKTTSSGAVMPVLPSVVGRMGAEALLLSCAGEGEGGEGGDGGALGLCSSVLVASGGLELELELKLELELELELEVLEPAACPTVVAAEGVVVGLAALTSATSLAAAVCSQALVHDSLSAGAVAVAVAGVGVRLGVDEDEHEHEHCIMAGP
jgi:hypothetical protein